MEILVTENLRKYYQLGDATVRALDGVSLTVEKGEFIAIVGRNPGAENLLYSTCWAVWMCPHPER